MNYKELNLYALEKGKQKPLITKKVLQYFLYNNVANTVRHEIPVNLLNIYNNKNNVIDLKFKRTLDLIRSVCKKYKISYLLFKTVKNFGEKSFGDIDLLIRAKDLTIFVNELKKKGFRIKIESNFKFECTKEGFCKIEPRKDIEFHSIKPFKLKQVWNNAIKIDYYGNSIMAVNPIFEAVYCTMAAFYGPKYLTLYDYKMVIVFLNQKFKSYFSSSSFEKDFEIIYNSFISKNNLHGKFPLFLPNTIFVRLWKQRFLTRKIKFYEKFKHLIFFIYMKYRYYFLSSLVFGHTWEE